LRCSKAMTPLHTPDMLARISLWTRSSGGKTTTITHCQIPLSSNSGAIASHKTLRSTNLSTCKASCLSWEILSKGRYLAKDWLTCRDLWNRKHLAVLAGTLELMNSGLGGMPQVHHAIPQALTCRYPVEAARDIVDHQHQDVVSKVKRHYL
jgi:hypothetical protein